MAMYRLPCIAIIALLLLELYTPLLASTGQSENDSTTGQYDTPRVLRNVQIVRKNIFGESGETLAIVPRAINALHVVTRENVIRREVWLQQGDSLRKQDIDELERNLRALDLFADVTITVQPVSTEPQMADLLIETRDRLSIVFSAGGSFLGGIGEVRFSVGEKNLFGLGHNLQFGYSTNTEGELLGSLAYDNVLLSGNDVYGSVQAGRTEEGDFSAVQIANRFVNFEDKDAWLIKLSTEETKIDFFEQGESVAEVPRETNRVQLNARRRYGADNRFWRFGPLLDFKDLRYAAATGTDAASIDVPDDTTELFVGGLIGYDHFREYRKVTWLDTLSFKQDLSLGAGFELAAGAERISTDADENTSPLVFLNAWSRNAIGEHNYLNAGLGSHVRTGGGDIDAWSVSAAMTWFNTGFRNQTLAARVRYESAHDESGLPPQQSLGEDKGLRGYPAREFNGEQSFFINLENRLRTPIELYSFRVGALGFFDTGWVGDRDQSVGDFLQDAHPSIGFGLRIGSRAILGKGVIRFDFAIPLDDDPARDYQPTLSVALGQVFGFKP